MTCSECQSPIPDDCDACPRCGTPAGSVEDMPTRLASSSPRSSSVWSGSGDTVVPGQVLGGRFVVLGLLGGGGMGQVFEAQDQELGVTVALKFLRTDVAAEDGMAQRFRGEARLAREIAHANVCRTYDIGEIEGRRFISMEYVPGADLRTVLRWTGGVRQKQLLRIGREVCAGLQAVHRAGVLHGDLKPANVLLDRHGRAKLTDFGLARFAAGPGGQGAGTPAYMAPEQFASDGAVDERADLYALGVMLYEMATGRTPFSADLLSDWSRAHREEAPIPPRRLEPSMDPALDEVIRRCLEKKPEDRFADLATLDAALEAVQRGLPLASLLPEKTWVLQSTRRKVAAVVAGALALFAVGLTLALTPGPALQLWANMPLELTPDAAEERARNVARAVGEGFEPHGRGRVRLEGDMAAVRAAAATDRADRLAPLRSGEVPGLRYRIGFEGEEPEDGEEAEWPFPGEPRLVERPGDFYVVLTGQGTVSRLAWWPEELVERDGVREQALELAGVDLDDFVAHRPAEARPCRSGQVVTETYRRSDPGLPTEETFRVTWWRRGPPEAGSSLDRGLLLEVERNLDYGTPQIALDLAPMRETRLWIGAMVVLLAIGLAAMIGILVHAWQRRAISIARSLVVGVSLGMVYLGLAAAVGVIAQDESLGKMILTVAMTMLLGVVLGLPLAALFAAGEAAGSIWLPRAVVGWQRFLAKGLRDPQVSVEAMIGIGAAGLGLLVTGGWEYVRHAAGWPPLIVPRETVIFGSHVVAVPLVLLYQVPWNFFLAFTLTGLVALGRRLVGQPLAAATLVVTLVLAAFTGALQSGFDLVAQALFLVLGVILLHRSGVVALFFYLLFSTVNGVIPMGVHEGAPFAAASALSLAFQVVAVLALCSFALLGVHRHAKREGATP